MPKAGQTLLVVPGQHGSQINRARPLRAVKAPHCLGNQRVHVHGLGPVAPTGRHGQRDSHPRVGKLVGALGRLGHAPDAGVGNHAFHRQSVRVPQVLGEEIRGGLRQTHRLVLQRFAHPLAPPVNRGANPYLGQGRPQTLVRRVHSMIFNDGHDCTPSLGRTIVTLKMNFCAWLDFIITGEKERG